MNAGRWILAFGLCLIVTAPGVAQTQKRIDDLVRKLGSPSYVQREQARKEIETIGTPCLETLRKLRGKSDLETTRRLDELIGRFEEQILTRQVLAAKEIQFNLKNVTVQEALAKLTELSGYPIQFQGDATRFADKKLTLELGKTTFWQAFDRVCAQGGLMERVDPAPPTPIVNQPWGGRARMRRIRLPMPAPTPQGPIVVTNRGSEKSFVSYAGAAKAELRIARVAGAKEFELTFTVSTEPRLQNVNVVGRPVLTKVVDQKQRKLRGLLETPVAKTDATATDFGISDLLMPAPSRIAKIRVKDGEQAAKAIKELTGKLAIQVDLHNEVVARVEKVLDAAGKSVAGANGGSITVNSIQKKNNGYEVQVSLENLTPNPFGGNIIVNGGNVIIRGNVQVRGMIIGPNGAQINGGSNGRDLPELLDAKGHPYRLGGVLAESTSIVNGSYSRSLRVIYYPIADGQTDPRELVLFGTRTHTIGVPFRFENLPLP